MRWLLLIAVIMAAGCGRPQPPAQPPVVPPLIAAPNVPDAGAAPALQSASVDYPGPVGLKWGASPAEVKGALSKKYRFTSQGPVDMPATVAQFYRGEFAGFAAEQIEADFYEDHLFFFAVILQARDQRPASKRWEEIVEKMVEAYGEPEKRSKALPTAYDVARERSSPESDPRPSTLLRKMHIAAEADLAARHYYDLDDQIRSGAWTPMALWRFKDDARISVTVEIGKPDQKGARTLRPAWFFMSRLPEGWRKANDADREY